MFYSELKPAYHYIIPLNKKNNNTITHKQKSKEHKLKYVRENTHALAKSAFFAFLSLIVKKQQKFKHQVQNKPLNSNIN